MTRITYNQGETFMLASFFQNEPPSLGPFYVGLGTGGAIINEAVTLEDLNEVVGQGYGRAVVMRDSSPVGWQIMGDMVQSPELVFTNTDPLNPWESADYAFLTMSSEGTLPPNILIAAVEFPKSIKLAPGKSIRLIFRFRQITEGTKFERIAHASVALIGSASASADAVVLP